MVELQQIISFASLTISGIMCVIALVNVSRSKTESDSTHSREMAEISVKLDNTTSSVRSIERSMDAAIKGYHDNREKILTLEQHCADIGKRVVDLENAVYGKEK